MESEAPAFAVLAYLQYRPCRKIHGIPAIQELAMRTKISIQMAELQVNFLIDRGLVTSNSAPDLDAARVRELFHSAG